MQCFGGSYRSWLVDPQAKQWKGKNFDLSKAYKQLAVDPSNWWASSIVTWDPVLRKPALFGQVTLPFGASGAVLAFNRASVFLWSAGIKILGVLWTNFYDDFPSFCPSVVCKSVQSGIELFFQMMGWRLTTDADKSFDFATSFASLGIIFDVGKLIVMGSTVTNKQTRITKVVEQLQHVRSVGSLVPALGDSLRGKIGFMESWVYGRAGRCVAPLFLRTGRSSFNLTERDNSLIIWLCNWLVQSPPRQISSKYTGNPVLIFSDGACEYEQTTRVVTCGALIFDL